MISHSPAAVDKNQLAWVDCNASVGDDREICIPVCLNYVFIKRKLDLMREEFNSYDTQSLCGQTRPQHKCVCENNRLIVKAVVSE